MRITWSIPFPDEVPEATRTLIAAKTKTRWERMLSAIPDTTVEVTAGSDWDPQAPVFEDIPGKKPEQKQWRKRLLDAATEVAQSAMAATIKPGEANPDDRQITED